MVIGADEYFALHSDCVLRKFFDVAVYLRLRIPFTWNVFSYLLIK